MSPHAGAQQNSERITVFLITGDRVEGTLHVPRHSRLIDILNHQSDLRPFIALTDAQWFHGEERTEHGFVCLNRSGILAVHPTPKP